MRYVKNLAGLVIVLGTFSLLFLLFVGAILGGLTLTFSGSFGLMSLFVLAVGVGGAYMMGGVLWLFVRNFSLRELMSPDAVTSRNDAPVALEIKLDGSKARSYLLDSRHSPRSTNPKKLGRGVYIMQRKRSIWQETKDVITLVDGKGSCVTNVRDFEDKIYYDDEKGNNHTISVAAVTEHTSNFEKKDSWDALLGGPDVSREKLAEQWADSLKRAK